MKTATEDMVFLTVMCRDSDLATAALVDAWSYAEVAGTWLQFLLIYCGMRQMGEVFV